jgi:FG-GAP repeat
MIQSMNQTSTHQRIRPAALTMPIGALVIGLASTAHAQPCDPLQVAKLRSTTPSINEELGNSIAINGDTAIVGALSDDFGNRSGSVSIFSRNGNQWIQQARLLADDGGIGDQFGVAVAISGDTAVIGANSGNNNQGNGSAYVFTRTNGVWTQQVKLLATNGSAFDRFGESVAIDGNTILVGSPFDANNSVNQSGAVHVFTGSGNIWKLEDVITGDSNTQFAAFGAAVSLDGDTAAIGAWNDDGISANSGSLSVFTRTANSWTLEERLLPDAGGAFSDAFGFSVSISGDTVLIGDWEDDELGNNSGAAYIFTRSGGDWTQVEKLVSDDVTDANFGLSVSIDGDIAVVGNISDSTIASVAGSAYVYTRDTGAWTLETKLSASDSSAGSQFGWSVAIEGEIVAVGMPNDDDLASNAGAAYVFDLHCNDCPADLTGDGVLNFFDVSAFIQLFAAGCP